MGGLFSRSKNVSRVTPQDKAVLQLKQQRDRIKQYQRKVEQNIERDQQMARELLRQGKKDRAKLILKKKKFQEQLLSKTDTQLENLERLVHDIEFAQIEIQVVNGLKSGNEALKKVHEILNIDDIEKIMEETQEGIEKQREIDEMLSGMLTQDDEEAILNELDDIVKSSLPDVPAETPEITLPEVPVTSVDRTKVKKKEKIAVQT